MVLSSREILWYCLVLFVYLKPFFRVIIVANVTKLSLIRAKLCTDFYSTVLIIFPALPPLASLQTFCCTINAELCREILVKDSCQINTMNALSSSLKILSHEMIVTENLYIKPIN
jgi:hypothetical protein